jgi:ABC-type glycerol-3-phosphate transport system permease component
MSMKPDRNRWSLPTLIAITLAAFVMLAPLIWTLLLSLKANSALVGNSGAAL